MTVSQWRTPDRIRVVAVAIVRDGRRILVFEGHDPSKPERFFRPIGGEVEFGEPADEALRREFHEELGVDLADIRYLTTIESRFVFGERPGHEYVRVYEATLVAGTVPATGQTGDGTTFPVVWLDLDDVRRGESILYPDGLLDALEGRREDD
jgi:8-oxo-dGTP pyrophosphatase MutT (NUDIX family)